MLVNIISVKETINITTTLLLLLLLYPFNGLFSRTTWVSRYQKGKTSLDLNEAKDYGIWGCSGISWTICKLSAPRCKQISTPTPHDSNFCRPGAVPDTQQTVSKHEGSNQLTLRNYSVYTAVRIENGLYNESDRRIWDCMHAVVV